MSRKIGLLYSLNGRRVYPSVEVLVISSPLDKMLFNTVLLRVHTILSISNTVLDDTMTLSNP